MSDVRVDSGPSRRWRLPALMTGITLVSGAAVVRSTVERLHNQVSEVRRLRARLAERRREIDHQRQEELAYACDPENVTRARAIIERDLGEMRLAPVRPAELLQARRLLLSSISLAESSEEEVAKGLLTRSAEDLPLDEPLRAAERYIQLEADDVEAAFRRWVRPERLAEVVLGPHP
jgi:predicted Zn-dependent peptidase